MRCRTRCYFCCFYTLLITFILSLFIFWLVVTSLPSFKLEITDATLSQFNLTTNNTLYYNFKVNITVQNPNKKIIIYYRRITATAWYKDNDFGRVSLTPFDQGHENTTFLQAVFDGQSVIKLKSKQLGEYNQETSVGIHHDLAVDFELRIRAKRGRFKSTRFNPLTIRCRRLSVPLISNGKTATQFSVRKCQIIVYNQVF